MIESWTLDGLPLTSGAFKLMQLTADPPRSRTDWLSAADSEFAVLTRKPLHENRTITMRLQVQPQPSMDDALDQIGALVDKLSAASDDAGGVPLVWSPHRSTRTATFTVLLGEVTGLPIGNSDQAVLWFRQQPVIDVEFTCRPYWEGDETSAGSETSSDPIVTLEIADVPGDVPATGRLVVTDLASQSRRHMEWGLEGPLTYDSGTDLLIDSDDLVTTGFSGAQATVTGAYDPNASGNNAISATLVAGTTTAICGTGDLGHVGTFRVKARVQSGSLDNRFRLSWKAGDGLLSSNAWASPLSTTGWQEIDLGSITIQAAVIGDQRWTGQVEVLAADDSPGTVALDYLELIPQGAGYGKARAAYAYRPGVVVAADGFASTTPSDPLNSRVAPLGGTWASSGDTTDFAFSSSESVSRSVHTDSSGRFALLGSTSYTDVEVSAKIAATADLGVGTAIYGVIARASSPGSSVSCLRASLQVNAVQAIFGLDQFVSGSLSGSAPNTAVTFDINTTYTIRLVCYASGHAFAFLLDHNGGVLASPSLVTSQLATGGSLATGKAGLWDIGFGSSVTTRDYDDFHVSTPAVEPIVIYSGQTMEVRTDDTYRDDSDGTYAAVVRPYNGSRFTVPAGTSRVAAKARRNDLETDIDDHIADSTKIEVFYTRRGLVIPRDVG